MVATKAVSEEARMATKDKGGKNTKRAASRTQDRADSGGR